MEKPLISVIVPIYMIDRYVGLCIESIINQTYKNLEIILVDDGSKDRCSDICDLYQAKDDRIKVIHKPNGGLVSARKAGLQESSGKYISYVDGDDWIGSEFIESLYMAAEKNDTDMVCAGFTRSLFDQSVTFTDLVPAGIYEGESLTDLWKRMLSNPPFYSLGISTYVWNKLFKRDVLLDVQARVDNRISNGEDGAVTYPALLKCTRVAVINSVAYHYRQREDSMLKQITAYSNEAQKLKYLYEFLIRWSESTDPELRIKEQVIDYVLSIALIRSGGRLPHDDYSTFDNSYFGKDVVIYSAGTFGQQLVNRFKESGVCRVVSWIDDDYWEYRRCCMDVDPVTRISSLSYDFILIASVNELLAEEIRKRLLELGVNRGKILTVEVPAAAIDREYLLRQFLDVDAIRNDERNRRGDVTSHA